MRLSQFDLAPGRYRRTGAVRRQAGDGPGLDARSGPAVRAPRAWRDCGGSKTVCFSACLMVVAAVPALASHLLVHFGVAGWSFHYVPALIALVALGAGGAATAQSARRSLPMPSTAPLREHALARLLAVAAVLAAMFWYYPTDYAQPGWRGSFDLSFCRFTRIGLKTPIPNRAPEYWRTANSRPLAGTPVRRPALPRADSG